MGIKETLTCNGNLNRIKEMTEAKIGNNAISGLFKDYGMDISPSEVSTLAKVIPELSKRPIPKKEVKKIIKAHKALDADFNGAIVA